MPIRWPAACVFTFTAAAHASRGVASDLCCREDGAVLLEGEPVGGTVPCRWDAITREGCASAKCQSLEVLTSIQNGALPKSQVELVISRNDEDISWTAPLEKIVSVRDYLDHIIERWDSLANRTVFMHSLQPSCGYFTRAGPRGNHLLLNTSLMDYVDPPSGTPPSHLPASAPAPAPQTNRDPPSHNPPSRDRLVCQSIARPCSPLVLHTHRY